MRCFIAVPTLAVVFVTVLSVGNATAGVDGPYGYSGRPSGHCEAPTHLSYYDPRNWGQTVYGTGNSPSDSYYYVDTNPLAGFQPTASSYSTTQTPDQDCAGTPVARVSIQFAATVWDKHVGLPACPMSGSPPSGTNPYCSDPTTGAHLAFYVGNADSTKGIGRTMAVTVP
jgi:hypothetical protein